MFKLLSLVGLLLPGIIVPAPQAADMYFTLSPDHDTIISREDRQVQDYTLTAKNRGDGPCIATYRIYWEPTDYYNSVPLTPPTGFIHRLENPNESLRVMESVKKYTFAPGEEKTLDFSIWANPQLNSDFKVRIFLREDSLDGCGGNWADISQTTSIKQYSSSLNIKVSVDDAHVADDGVLDYAAMIRCEAENRECETDLASDFMGLPPKSAILGVDGQVTGADGQVRPWDGESLAGKDKFTAKIRLKNGEQLLLRYKTQLVL